MKGAAFAVSLALLGCLALPATAPAAASTRAGGGESQIDESSPDEGPAEGGGLPRDVAGRLRAFAVGSLARFDGAKSAAAGFRRQGWFPSCWLRDEDADLETAPEPGGGLAVTVHVSCARRDIDQQLAVGPLDRFLLPAAERRFFAELVADLADLAPQVTRARLRFWFASLQVGGQLVWEDRGAIAITAAAARRVPAGARTSEAVWPLLEENTVPAALWPE